MNNYYLNMPGGLTISFQTACNLLADDEARLYLGAHLPGATISLETEALPDVTVKHVFADKTRLVEQDNHIRYEAPDADQFTRDICHLLYGIERKALIDKSLYPVHAACVGEGDHYTLIVGHSGAGKTTISDALVEQSGLKLFSGNKTVIRFEDDGTIKAIAGTKTVTRLDDNQKRHACALPEEQYADQQEVTISSIHMVNLNDGVAERQELARTPASVALHPFFMDAVNADVIVGKFHVFNGTTAPSSKHHLLRNLRRSLRDFPVVKTSGSLDYVTAQIKASMSPSP